MTYLRFFFKWLEAKPRTSKIWYFMLPQSRTERRHFDLIADLDLALWASFLFKTSRIRWLPTGTLRKWNPRPACGTAISSVRISISVFGLVPTRDEPAECLPWTRGTGVCRYLPCFGDVSVRSGQQVA